MLGWFSVCGLQVSALRLKVNPTCISRACFIHMFSATDPQEEHMETTPTTQSAINPVRVLVAYGSESGSTKRLISRVIKRWADRGATFHSDLMSGNEAVQKFGSLETIAKSYDVLIVSTCSYGCGEPPVNINMLFEQLKDNATVGSLSTEPPLHGLQHAVFGCGSTFYETFQNCPRMHDKFLGECGSRRLAMRAELDDIHELAHNEQPHYLRWTEEVFKALQNLPSADTPPVCDWDQPAGRITKTMSPSTSCPTDIAPFVGCGAAVGCAFLFGVAHMLDLVPAWLVACGGFLNVVPGMVSDLLAGPPPLPPPPPPAKFLGLF